MPFQPSPPFTYYLSSIKDVSKENAKDLENGDGLYNSEGSVLSDMHSWPLQVASFYSLFNSLGDTHTKSIGRDPSTSDISSLVRSNPSGDASKSPNSGVLVVTSPPSFLTIVIFPTTLSFTKCQIRSG